MEFLDHEVKVSKCQSTVVNNKLSFFYDFDTEIKAFKKLIFQILS